MLLQAPKRWSDVVIHLFKQLERWIYSVLIILLNTVGLFLGRSSKTFKITFNFSFCSYHIYNIYSIKNANGNSKMVTSASSS